MAPPRTVAKSLRRSAQRLARVPSEAVVAGAEIAVEQATSIGGSFAFGSSRAYRLYGSVTKVSVKKSESSAIVHGVPVGAWAMKSNGRRGGYDVRARDGGPLDLRAAGGSAAMTAHVDRSTSGDDRWRRVLAAVEQEYPDVVGDLVSGALDG